MRRLVPPCGEFLRSQLQGLAGGGGGWVVVDKGGGQAEKQMKALTHFAAPKRSLKPNRMYAGAGKSRWGHKPRPSPPGR